MEAGKMELMEEKYYLDSILFDVSNMIEMNLQGRAITYHMELVDEVPNGLIGDSIGVRRIMTNILGNAVKYTEQGTITMKVWKEETEDFYLCFSVTDTGCGILEEDKEKIFESYEQADVKKNRKVMGTGLGLAITRKLVDMMDGSIQVESEYQKGSCFTVRIKQAVFDKSPSEQKNINSDILLSQGIRNITRVSVIYPKAHILVVDDVELNLRVASGLLKKFQMQIDTANSADQAIKKAQERKYDLIFMDHMMPDKDGVETMEEIRKIPGRENIPAIALTANAIRGMKEFFEESGFQDYLAKPISQKRLIQVLRKWMPEELQVKVENVEDHSKERVRRETDKLEKIYGLTFVVRPLGLPLYLDRKSVV